MLGIQSKMNRYTKKWGNRTYIERNDQPVKTNTELTQMLELSDKHSKIDHKYFLCVPMLLGDMKDIKNRREF
jgi:hypothetical protein